MDAIWAFSNFYLIAFTKTVYGFIILLHAFLFLTLKFHSVIIPLSFKSAMTASHCIPLFLPPQATLFKVFSSSILCTFHQITPLRPCVLLYPCKCCTVYLLVCFPNVSVFCPPPRIFLSHLFSVTCTFF